MEASGFEDAASEHRQVGDFINGGDGGIEFSEPREWL
jgi:hypothetical protein